MLKNVSRSTARNFGQTISRPQWAAQASHGHGQKRGWRDWGLVGFSLLWVLLGPISLPLVGFSLSWVLLGPISLPVQRSDPPPPP